MNGKTGFIVGWRARPFAPGDEAALTLFFATEE